MQTDFTLAQLADADVAESEKILRTCVHCGFCLSTCPTYVLLGDELDSPRGRIYLIKDMLEGDKPASDQVVTHIDRCLSCLACMTTCPSGVHYMHLVDHARARIEETYTRPPAERWLRAVLAGVLAHPGRVRLALLGAWLARPLARLAPARWRALLDLTPARLPPRGSSERPRVHPAEGPRRARVALLTGCVQPVLAPEINEATVRLLTRHGVEVVVARGVGCCGALAHHLGKQEATRGFVAANLAAWSAEMEDGGLDAVVVNTSGCGTMVKDYGFLMREDPAWAAKAAAVAERAKDVAEFLDELGLAAPGRETNLAVAYQSPCSMQHGQRVHDAPRRLLAAAGFTVLDMPEGHLCCGSAGTYNLLQPDLAGRLRARKIAAIESVRPRAVATGNVGCLLQIAGGTEIPVVHTVELLDWATGGPMPARLAAAGVAPGEERPAAARAAE